MKYKETIDLYDDEGKLLKSGVTLDKISPCVNKGAQKILDLSKRTVAFLIAATVGNRAAAVASAVTANKIGRASCRERV